MSSLFYPPTLYQFLCDIYLEADSWQVTLTDGAVMPHCALCANICVLHNVSAH